MPDNINDQPPSIVVIFDGICHLCNWSVNFIINRDQHGKVHFSPMQSKFAVDLMAQYDVDNHGLNTCVLVKDGEISIRSAAALELCKSLDGFWHWFSVLKIIPRPIRDALYKLIANNRYRWFGKSDYCMTPDESLHARFRL